MRLLFFSSLILGCAFSFASKKIPSGWECLKYLGPYHPPARPSSYLPVPDSELAKEIRKIINVKTTYLSFRQVEVLHGRTKLSLNELMIHLLAVAQTEIASPYRAATRAGAALTEDGGILLAVGFSDKTGILGGWSPTEALLAHALTHKRLVIRKIALESLPNQRDLRLASYFRHPENEMTYLIPREKPLGLSSLFTEERLWNRPFNEETNFENVRLGSFVPPEYFLTMAASMGRLVGASAEALLRSIAWGTHPYGFALLTKPDNRIFSSAIIKVAHSEEPISPLVGTFSNFLINGYTFDQIEKVSLLVPEYDSTNYSKSLQYDLLRLVNKKELISVTSFK